MKPNRYNHYLRLSQQLGFELHLWTDQINNHTLKCPPHGLSHHSNSSWTFLSLKFLLDFPITQIPPGLSHYSYMYNQIPPGHSHYSHVQSKTTKKQCNNDYQYLSTAMYIRAASLVM